MCCKKINPLLVYAQLVGRLHEEKNTYIQMDIIIIATPKCPFEPVGGALTEEVTSVCYPKDTV